jgi:16S rRNA (cytidine1402-2'-O)-methyltransferase
VLAGLYVVATPIGNAADISARALDVLGRVDAIACEDKRVTAKLMALHGIRTALVAYHEHNAERMRPILLERLSKGESIALVSDAGTPLVSDPGYKLVRAAIEAELPLTALPGPSAPLTALVLSGIPTDRFLFAGFLPNKSAARKSALTELAPVKATLVFLEAKQRLAASLAEMAEVLGPRPAAVARELTKMFEEVRRGSLADLARHYEEAGEPLGEITVVIGPPTEKSGSVTEADLDSLLRSALASQSLSDAVADVTEATGLPRRRVYARALALKEQR